MFELSMKDKLYSSQIDSFVEDFVDFLDLKS